MPCHCVQLAIRNALSLRAKRGNLPPFCHCERSAAIFPLSVIASEARQSLIPARDSHATLRSAQNDSGREASYRVPPCHCERSAAI